jgi:hypothetical protein
MEPLFQRQFLQPYTRARNLEEEQIIRSREDGEDIHNEADALWSAGVKLSRPQRAQLARMVGDTMIRLGRLEDALIYYNIAFGAETSAAARKARVRDIADAKAALRLREQNAERQPILHEPLEQDRVVRPQLLAHAAPVAKNTTTKGGAKR